jgi:MYXO-CTERM domain-containing protein
MQPNCTHFRNPAIITNSRWLAYAAAGAATAFASASSAEAAIHYSGLINHDFANGGFVGALDPGVTLELNVGTGTWVGSGLFSFGAINIRGPLHSAVGDFVGSPGLFAYFFLSELPAGAFLPTQRFGQSCRWSSSCGCQVCYGAQFGGTNFRSSATGFVGFVFSHGGGGIQYGWARLKTSGPPEYHAVLLDYAWGDPGDRFFTGQRRLTPCVSTPCSNEPREAPPKEGSLGGLALGAAGLLAWRKRRPLKL